MKLPKKVQVHYVFPSKDDFGGDYYSVRLLFDGKVVATFGDYYHDKGDVQAESFVRGFFAAHDKKLPKLILKDVEDKSLAQ